jgi:hypothetical protein
MWDSRLAALAAGYPTGVLSWVHPSGYPVSVRCRVTLDATRACVTFDALPPAARDWRGPACLLLHAHDARLEDLRQMVLTGELVVEGGAVVLRVSEFVTANGRRGTDRLPHAGAPLHMLQFYRLGRRKADDYLKRRGEPWPPIPFDAIARAVAEPPGPPATEELET